MVESGEICAQAIKSKLASIGAKALSYRQRLTSLTLIFGLVLFSLTQTLGLLQFFSQSLSGFPTWTLKLWIPVSQFSQPILLFCIFPSDRRLTVIAAILLSILCTYYLTIYITMLLLHDLHDEVAIARVASYVFSQSVWGAVFLFKGPAVSLKSLIGKDDKWEINPRAALDGLMNNWRGSTLTFATFDLVCIYAGSVLQV